MSAAAAADRTGAYFVSVVEAGRRLGVGRSCAYDLVASGRLRVGRIGRRVLVPVVEVERLAAELIAAERGTHGHALTRLILSMCPEWVCATCGQPRRRIEGKSEYVPSPTFRGGVMRANASRVAAGVNQWTDEEGRGGASVIRVAPTLGWTDCGHDNYRPGVVLDPFAGAGTTLAVADHHRRDAVGIDLYDANRDLYPARRAEVIRNLTGRPAPDPDQLDLFGADL